MFVQILCVLFGCVLAVSGQTTHCCNGYQVQIQGTEPTCGRRASKNQQASPQQKISDQFATYRGCYQDYGQRIMGDSQQVFPNQTPSQCQAFCAGNNYKIAGLEYNTQCYCGNSLSQQSQLPDSRCMEGTVQNGPSIGCPNSAAEACGGYYAMAVYDLNPAAAPQYNGAQVPQQRPREIGTLRGCYQDYGARIMGDVLQTFADNSPQKCQAYCVGQGYKIAGLEYGTQCYCGNSLVMANPLDMRKCFEGTVQGGPAVGCPQDVALPCGGYYAMTVYDLNV